MVAEITTLHPFDTVEVTTPAAGYAAGEVVQLTDGRAGVVQGLKALTSGETASIRVAGHGTAAKVSGVVVIKGAPLYFKRSSNALTPVKALSSGDFYVGVALNDVASTTLTVEVDLNVEPRYLIDLHRDAFESLIVKTVVGSTTVTIPEVVTRGGQTELKFGLTAEAQKVDLMSKNSVPVSVPFVVEGRCAVYDIGDDAALDLNIGVANGTHATDADAITESVFFHLDGNVLTILAESDDGTTEVNAVTTTIAAVDDTYFDFAIDARNLNDIQLYINGVNVLPDSVFKLNAATGPLKLLAHMEKTSNDTPGDFRVSHFALRTFDLV